MKTRTHTRLTYTIPGTEIEVELPCQPDSIMDYKEPLVKITDGQIVLGYLAHDDDCANPLEDCDGMGHIYDCRRHSRTLRDYEVALGLADGGPDLGLVDENEVVAEAHKRIAADPDMHAKALEHCEEHWPRLEGDTDENFVTSCLDSINELTPIINVEAIQLDLWREGRKSGKIGNPYTVMLDVYEHGGISYSLSGQGMQCQWDTARGGAVWVPDEVCIEEIHSRAAVYVKGDIIEMRTRGPNSRPYAVRTLSADTLGYDDTVHPTFDEWYKAYEYLEGLPGSLAVRDLAEAEQIAARELAKQAAEQYTDWSNGNCFCTVTVTYEKCISLEPLPEIGNDTCGGYIGGDYAYETLKSEFPKED